MRASTSSSAIALLALAAADAFVSVSAVPSPAASPPGQTMRLSRRTVNRTVEEWGVWAKSHRESLINKYSSGSSNAKARSKRGAGTNLITNQNADSSYFGSLAIGTPAVAFDVILDTGSADLWVADSNCKIGCESISTYDASSSSTYVNLTKTFTITYGSGAAAGDLAQDVVEMAGFSVSNQTFATVDQVSPGLLTSPVSGLLGLAFKTIASSGATPFWENLVESGAWDSPVMSFQLTRYVNQSAAQALEPGGTFTMGFVNDSLYTGSIDFVDIPGGQGTYWILELTNLTVQGNSVTLTSGSGSYAAIDTGTTLVGGPSNVIAQMYSNIPGAVPGTGNYEGYYIYPCSETVNVDMTYGSRTWPISPADFELTQLSNSQCLGAFFDLNMSGSSAPSWIVGDTFLKNVYSVFRYNPPSVGFATLSSVATAMNGDLNAAVASATIGSSSSTVTASHSGSASSSAGSASPVRIPIPTLLAVLGVVAGLFSVV